jgi:cytochrome d ubiquinol oxidase subunit II
MELTTVWFCLIAVLWTGYFVLEGFDFGVGALLRILGRNEPERRTVIGTIGPIWDGNEVWVLTAGGATFAAFPEWYATMFSGFYLALLLILLALILRGVAIEYRNKRPDAAWRNRWDTAIVVGSALPGVLWGVALTNLLAGVPIDRSGEFVGSFFTLLRPFPLLGGVAIFSVFIVHAAVFVGLKTTGDLRDRANALARRVFPVSALLVVAFFVVGYTVRGNAGFVILAGLAVVAFVGAAIANRADRDGWAFAGTAAAIVFTTIAMFAALFPDVMPTTLADGMSLTVTNASSSAYTLRFMSIVALVFVPVVLAYQGWTYWVFRKRITVPVLPATPVEPAPVPVSAR